MSGTAVLSLQFKVEGTTTSVAQINAFRSSLASAADDINSRWLGPLDKVERSLDGIGARAAGAFKTGMYAAAGAVGALTYAFVGLGRGFVEINTKFAQFEITLTSSLKSVTNARRIVDEVARVTATSPIAFKDIAESVTGLSVLPQLNATFSKQAQSNQLSAADGILRRSIKLVEMMTTFRPDKGAGEAVFAIREALTGQFRSLQRRFDVPTSILTQASGVGIKELQNRGPEAILDSMYKAFSAIITPEAIQQRARQVDKALENLYEQMFQMPALAIGRAGVMDKITDKLNDYLNTASNFFTRDASDPSKGGFETKGYADRISISLGRIFDTVTDKIAGIAENVLARYGYGEDSAGTGILERASKALADGFEWLADKLPSIMDGAIAFGSKVASLLSDLASGLISVVKWFTEFSAKLGPAQTIIAAMYGPRLIGALGEAGLKAGVRGISTAGKSMFLSGANGALDEASSLMNAADAAAIFAKKTASAATDTAAIASSVAAANPKLIKAFSTLTEEAELAAKGFRASRIRATADIADALNLVGITTSGGKAVKKGFTVVSQDMLAAGAIGAGSMIADKTAAAAAAAEGKAIGAEVAAVLAKGTATAATAAVPAAAAAAATAALVSLGVLAAALVASGGVVWESFKQWQSMREAETAAIDSSTRAQQAFAAMAKRAYEDLALGATPGARKQLDEGKQREELARLLLENMKASSKAFDKVSVMDRLFRPSIREGYSNQYMSSRKQLVELLGTNTDTRLAADGNYVVSGKQKVSLMDGAGKLIDLLSATILESSRKANAEIEREDPGMRERARQERVAVRNAFAQTDVNAIQSTVGLGDTSRIFSTSAVSNLHANKFSAMQDAIKVAAGDAEEYTDALVAYNSAYKSKTEEIAQESLRIASLSNDSIFGKLKKLGDQIKRYADITGSETYTLGGSEINIKKRLAEISKYQQSYASRSYLPTNDYTPPESRPFNPSSTYATSYNRGTMSPTSAISPLDAARLLGVGSTASLNKEAAEHNASIGSKLLGELMLSLSNAVPDGPLAKQAIDRFGSNMGAIMASASFSPKLTSIDSKFKSAGSQFAQANKIDPEYALGMRKFDLELEKARLNSAGYSSALEGAQASIVALGVVTKEDTSAVEAKTSAENLVTLSSQKLTESNEVIAKLTRGRAEALKQNTMDRALEEAQQEYVDILEKMSRGYRVSMSARISNAEKRATNASYSEDAGGVASSFGAGFKSQFPEMTGQDFTNLSEIGVKSAQSVSGAWGDAFYSMISGTKSVKSAFRDMATAILKYMAEILAKQAAAQILNLAVTAIGTWMGGTKVPVANSAVNYKAPSTGTMYAADGGSVMGGSGIRDDVPAMLTGGEYVLNKAAVARLGVENLDQWNSGKVSGYATGGYVGTYSGGSSSPTASQTSNGGVNVSVTYNASSSGAASGESMESQSDKAEAARQLQAMIVLTVEKWDRNRRISGRSN